MPTETVHRTLTLRTAVSMTNFGAADGGPGSLEGLPRMGLDEKSVEFREKKELYVPVGEEK